MFVPSLLHSILVMYYSTITIQELVK